MQWNTTFVPALLPPDVSHAVKGVVDNTFIGQFFEILFHFWNLQKTRKILSDQGLVIFNLFVRKIWFEVQNRAKIINFKKFEI